MSPGVYLDALYPGLRLNKSCVKVSSFSLYCQNSVESAYIAVDLIKLPAL